MIQLNLLPDLKRQFIEAQRARNRVISICIIVVIAVVGLTGLAAFYVYGVQNIQISLANSDIASKTKKLNDVSDINKYLTLQNQLSSLDTLHQNKNVYSRILDFLPTLNPSQPNSITLTSLQVFDTDKSITFNGTAPSFQAVTTFQQALTNAQASYVPAGATDPTTEPLFDTVTLQSSGLGLVGGQSVVSFGIKVTFKPELLISSSSKLKVSVPNIANTSANGQTPIFGGSN